MTRLFCINCGAEIPQGARYCAACGSPAPLPPSQPAQQHYHQQPAQQPPMQHTPYQQPAVPYPGYDSNVPPALPLKKKSSAGIIVFIALLALVVLGAVGWALYKYVINPRSMQDNIATASTGSNEERISFSTESSTDDQPMATDSTSIDLRMVETEPEIASQEPEIESQEPEITSQEPEITSQESDVPSIPKQKVKPAQRSEPWGMTDEEAAQMQRYSGEPWGMTDEEAAQMRQMQKQQRMRRR